MGDVKRKETYSETFDSLSCVTNRRWTLDRADAKRLLSLDEYLRAQYLTLGCVRQMTAFREDVKKLRDLATQQAEVRQALRDRDETITGGSHEQQLGEYSRKAPA